MRKVIGWTSILAPAAHSLTDVIELIQHGFSPFQLWLNYLAFLPMPALLLGLCFVQRKEISWSGVIGAVLYGFAFVYFSFTTLYALTVGVSDYALLWQQTGSIYIAHGALMIVGGIAFGIATLRAKVLPSWTAWIFICGLSINLIVALLPVPEILQTIGSFIRNAGLICMGIAIICGLRKE